MPLTFLRTGAIALAAAESNLDANLLCQKLNLPHAFSFTELEQGTVPLTPELLWALSELLSKDVEYFIPRFLGCPQLAKHFADSTIPKAPYSQEFAEDLHRALDRGQCSARWAAKLLGVSLAELADIFKEKGMRSPFETFAADHG